MHGDKFLLSSSKNQTRYSGYQNVKNNVSYYEPKPKLALKLVKINKEFFMARRTQNKRIKEILKGVSKKK